VTAHAFTVDGDAVLQVKHLIGELVKHARWTQMNVSTADFPVWCAALGVNSFLSFRRKAGHTWVSTGTTHLVTTDNQDEYRMVSVNCDQAPADWVTFPDGEGDRRWMFKVDTGDTA
jgi:hypothetical protein